MQPTQLSLLPEQLTTPAPQLLIHLPDAQVAAAVALLAPLLAKATAEVSGDE